MEDKKQTAQELDHDQMENVSGGAVRKVMNCPWCGKQYFAHMYKQYIIHVQSCPSKSSETTTHP